MKLTKNDINNILVGSSLLGTGGGGRFDLAKKIATKIKNPIWLETIDNISENDLIVTTFMVGGLKKKGDLGTGIAKSIGKLKEILNREIKYLIPVEIGPTAVINLLNIASKTNLSVIDGDLVGYRSAPEIYVEAITLNNVNRLPIVAVNLEGDTIVLSETESIKKIETILRTFSAQSKTEVYVAGYPVYKRQIKNFFGNGSLSYALKVGECLTNNKKNTLLKNLSEIMIIYLAQGQIISQEEKDNNGFTSGKLTIDSGIDMYEVIYNNEYLVLLKNNTVLLTSPDSILLLDVNQRRGINNSENNKGKQVYILAKKAIPAWRTMEGKKLFSPISLGFDYQQKLLK